MQPPQWGLPRLCRPCRWRLLGLDRLFGPCMPGSPLGPVSPLSPRGMVKFSTGAEAVPELVTVAFEPGAPVVVSPTVTETLPLPAPFCPFRFGVVIDPFLSVMVSLYSVPVLLATETVGLTPSAPFAPCGPGVPSAEMPVSVSPVIQCFVALSIWGVMPGWPGVPGAPASPGSPFGQRRKRRYPGSRETSCRLPQCGV